MWNDLKYRSIQISVPLFMGNLLLSLHRHLAVLCVASGRVVYGKGQSNHWQVAELRKADPSTWIIRPTEDAWKRQPTTQGIWLIQSLDLTYVVQHAIVYLYWPASPGVTPSSAVQTRCLLSIFSAVCLASPLPFTTLSSPLALCLRTTDLPPGRALLTLRSLTCVPLPTQRGNQRWLVFQHTPRLILRSMLIQRRTGGHRLIFLAIRPSLLHIG